MLKKIDVLGMTCEHCEKAVHDALVNESGVEQVLVNLDEANVTVKFNEEKTSLELLEEKIEAAGYEVK